MALIANEHVAQHEGTTSTGTLLWDTLNFNASYWRVINRGTLPLYLCLTTTAASTGDHRLAAGESQEFSTPQSNKYSVGTTSTSTDGLDHRRARVYALGG